MARVDLFEDKGQSSKKADMKVRNWELNRRKCSKQTNCIYLQRVIENLLQLEGKLIELLGFNHSPMRSRCVVRDLRCHLQVEGKKYAIVEVKTPDIEEVLVV